MSVIIPNLLKVRQGEAGPRYIRLMANGEYYDLSDTTAAYLKVGNEAMNALYVDATCTIAEPPTGRIRWDQNGTEFASMTFAEETSEHRLRAIVWAHLKDGITRVPFPREEGGTVEVTAGVFML